jgi:hypothetical protein
MIVTHMSPDFDAIGYVWLIGFCIRRGFSLVVARRKPPVPRQCVMG